MPAIMASRTSTASIDRKKKRREDIERVCEDDLLLSHQKACRADLDQTPTNTRLSLSVSGGNHA
jgi:hypothetical protein